MNESADVSQPNPPRFPREAPHSSLLKRVLHIAYVEPKKPGRNLSVKEARVRAVSDLLRKAVKSVEDDRSLVARGDRTESAVREKHGSDFDPHEIAVLSESRDDNEAFALGIRRDEAGNDAAQSVETERRILFAAGERFGAADSVRMRRGDDIEAGMRESVHQFRLFRSWIARA